MTTFVCEMDVQGALEKGLRERHWLRLYSADDLSSGLLYISYLSDEEAFHSSQHFRLKLVLLFG